MDLVINVAGEKQVSRRLLRFADRSADMRPAFHLIHGNFLEVERAQFDSEGSAGGDPWTPLKASTIAAKERAGLDTRILHATLRLRESLTEENSDEHIFRATKKSMSVGTRTPYAIYHQSVAPRHQLPRRPVIQLNEVQKREWMKILQRWWIGGALP